MIPIGECKARFCPSRKPSVLIDCSSRRTGKSSARLLMLHGTPKKRLPNGRFQSLAGSVNRRYVTHHISRAMVPNHASGQQRQTDSVTSAVAVARSCPDRRHFAPDSGWAGRRSSACLSLRLQNQLTVQRRRRRRRPPWLYRCGFIFHYVQNRWGPGCSLPAACLLLS